MKSTPAIQDKLVDFSKSFRNTFQFFTFFQVNHKCFSIAHFFHIQIFLLFTLRCMFSIFQITAASDAKIEKASSGFTLPPFSGQSQFNLIHLALAIVARWFLQARTSISQEFKIHSEIHFFKIKSKSTIALHDNHIVSITFIELDILSHPSTFTNHILLEGKLLFTSFL